jgi:hypothetical protein
MIEQPLVHEPHRKKAKNNVLTERRENVVQVDGDGSMDVDLIDQSTKKVVELSSPIKLAEVPVRKVADQENRNKNLSEDQSAGLSDVLSSPTKEIATKSTSRSQEVSINDLTNLCAAHLESDSPLELSGLMFFLSSFPRQIDVEIFRMVVCEKLIHDSLPMQSANVIFEGVVKMLSQLPAEFVVENWVKLSSFRHFWKAWKTVCDSSILTSNSMHKYLLFLQIWTTLLFQDVNIRLKQGRPIQLSLIATLTQHIASTEFSHGTVFSSTCPILMFCSSSRSKKSADSNAQQMEGYVR